MKACGCGICVCWRVIYNNMPSHVRRFKSASRKFVWRAYCLSEKSLSVFCSPKFFIHTHNRRKDPTKIPNAPGGPRTLWGSAQQEEPRTKPQSFCLIITFSFLPYIASLFLVHILNKRMYNNAFQLTPNFLSPQVLLSAVVFIKTHSAAVRTLQGGYTLISSTVKAVISGRSGPKLSLVEEALRCSDMAASGRTVSAILHHSCCIMLHEYYNAGVPSLKLPPAKCQMPVKYVLCG